MKKFLLLIITLINFSAIFSQENYEGLWQRDDNSIYEIKNHKAFLVKVGTHLYKGNFKKGDIKIKDFHVENGVIYAFRRINDIGGELLRWQKIRIIKRNNVVEIINDKTGRILTSLRRISKGDVARIKNVAPNKLIGKWKRINDGSVYSFEGDIAVIKRVGYILEKGEFYENQVKIRNITQVANNLYSAQDRLNDNTGNVLKWENVTIRQLPDKNSLIIRSINKKRVQRLEKVNNGHDSHIVVSEENNDNNKKPKATELSDVDINIPVSSNVKSNTFALIIGNEDYSSFQVDLTNEINVDYALNDAKVFKNYVVKTLGVPERNVILLINATYGQMQQGIVKLNKLSELSEGKANLIFYYAGHGLPDEVTKEAYIMPVDISGSNVTSGIKLNDVYKKLLQFPNKKVTVFLDACFSGGARNQGLIAMRGVKIQPKKNALFGNLVVFTSSSNKESSASFKEEHHGLFTYYLLKKLQESKGNLSYKELSDYLAQKVKLESVLINSKEQTPQTNVSPDVKDAWQNWKFK